MYNWSDIESEEYDESSEESEESEDNEESENSSSEDDTGPGGWREVPGLKEIKIHINFTYLYKNTDQLLRTAGATTDFAHAIIRLLPAH